ncbi:unnamed protein product [Linum trigynum]|uniref:Uncharacterized protein n=1 Tax=Linum trigynum TaxID=586398 RepID=A0AAV2G5L1_9ROSI
MCGFQTLIAHLPPLKASIAATKRHYRCRATQHRRRAPTPRNPFRKTWMEGRGREISTIPPRAKPIWKIWPRPGPKNMCGFQTLVAHLPPLKPPSPQPKDTIAVALPSTAAALQLRGTLSAKPGWKDEEERSPPSYLGPVIIVAHRT